jgi:hypothetical protein
MQYKNTAFFIIIICGVSFAARLERSSFCGAKRNKKAGVEDGNAAQKRLLRSSQ